MLSDGPTDLVDLLAQDTLGKISRQMTGSLYFGHHAREGAVSVRIRIAGVEATVDVEMRWRVTQVNDTNSELVRSLERFLNTAYGIEWQPAFGVYEPSMTNAAAQAVATELGAEVLELEEAEEDAPEGRVY